jgi:hypothetical protein
MSAFQSFNAGQGGGWNPNPNPPSPAEQQQFRNTAEMQRMKTGPWSPSASPAQRGISQGSYTVWNVDPRNGGLYSASRNADGGSGITHARLQQMLAGGQARWDDTAQRYLANPAPQRPMLPGINVPDANGMIMGRPFRDQSSAGVGSMRASPGDARSIPSPSSGTQYNRPFTPAETRSAKPTGVGGGSANNPSIYKTADGRYFQDHWSGRREMVLKNNGFTPRTSFNQTSDPKLR